VSAALAAIVLSVAAWWAGALDDWYDITIRFNSQVYAQQKQSLIPILLYLGVFFTRYWHWYTALSVLGVAVLVRSRERSLLGLLGLVLCVTVASAFAQAKGFGYHFGGCLPVLGGLASCALGVSWAWAIQGGGSWPRRVVGYSVVLLAITGTASKVDHQFGAQILWHLGRLSDDAYYARHDVRDPIEVARFLRAHTSASETVWCYSYDNLINTLADRRSPVRFTNCYLVMWARAPFDGADRWLGDVRDVLRYRPPRYIVLRRASRRADPADYTCLRWDDTTPPAKLVREILAHQYRLVQTIRSYDLYELQGSEASGSLTRRMPGPSSEGPRAAPKSGAPTGTLKGRSVGLESARAPDPPGPIF
jgi:hypothetical protein